MLETLRESYIASMYQSYSCNEEDISEEDIDIAITWNVEMDMDIVRINKVIEWYKSYQYEIFMEEVQF